MEVGPVRFGSDWEDFVANVRREDHCPAAEMREKGLEVLNDEGSQDEELRVWIMKYQGG